MEYQFEYTASELPIVSREMTMKATIYNGFTKAMAKDRGIVRPWPYWSWIHATRPEEGKLL
jgi:hypothetical protein